METQLPPKGEGHIPQFSAHVYCGQTAGWIKMSLGAEVGLGPGDIVLDGAQLPPPQKKEVHPQFSAYVYCGQTVAHLSYCELLSVILYVIYYIARTLVTCVCSPGNPTWRLIIAAHSNGEAIIFCSCGCYLFMVAIWHRADHHIFIL